MPRQRHANQWRLLLIHGVERTAVHYISQFDASLICLLQGYHGLIKDTALNLKVVPLFLTPPRCWDLNDCEEIFRASKPNTGCSCIAVA